MTIQDPKRLVVDEGATAFERHWLSAAQVEDLPADVASKIEHALGIGTVPAAAPAVPAPVPAAVTTAVKGGAWGLRLAGLSALGVTGTVGLVLFLSRTPSPPSAPTERPAVTSPAPASVPAAPAAPVAAATTDSLADEIAMIDGARTALAAGSPSRALALLDRYGARYPQGTLAPEAQAMRIEALDRSDHARAQSLARAFLRQYPQSPLAQRVAAIARGR